MKTVSLLLNYLPGLALFALACYVPAYHTFWRSALFLAGTVHLYSTYSSYLKITSIKGRGVLITGCDTGFGHHLAQRLYSLGFTVFACCLDDNSEGACALKLLNQNDVEKRMHVLKLDITKDDQISQTLQYVEGHLPELGLWGLVNNAGVWNTGYIEAVSMETIEKVNAVNMYGPIRMTKTFLPLIRKTQGRIVNVSSIFGRTIAPLMAAYCIGKFGVEAFTDILRLEMKQFNVKVCTIEPGNHLNATNLLWGDGSKDADRYFLMQLNNTVREAYNKDKLYKDMKNFSFFAKMASNDRTVVVDAMCDALTSVYPKTHYFVANFCDKAMAFLISYPPAYFSDMLVDLIGKAMFLVSDTDSKASKSL